MGARQPTLMGRTQQIASFDRMEFIKLQLNSDRSGAQSVVTQKATAEFFGWDKAFPEWSEATRVRPDGSPYPGRSLRKVHSLYRGGDRLRICRSKTKKGTPQGMTHCFRMCGCWSRKHLVQLAEVAGDKFEWMEDTRYKRVDRDVWLSLAGRGKPPAGD